MEKLTIGYLTEDPTKKYVKALKKVKTKEELEKVLWFYREITPEGYKDAKKFTDSDVIQMQKDWKKAKKDDQDDKFIEEFLSKFGNILVPSRLLLTSVTADRFKAPWGTAFIRLKELGKFKK